MKHSEIQVGDTIEVRSVLKVEAVRQEADGVRLQFKNEKDSMSVVRLLPDDEVKLVERPLPPLPTEPGSVIEVAGERWFYQHGISPRRWINSYGGHLWPESLALHAQNHGGFEVLL